MGALDDLAHTCRVCREWDGTEDNWGRCRRNAVDVGLDSLLSFARFNAFMRTRGDFGCIHWKHYAPTYFVHPGHVADEERKARGWTVDDLSARLHTPNDWTTEFLLCDLSDMQDADFYALADAFNTTPSLWRNLWQQWKEKKRG